MIKRSKNADPDSQAVSEPSPGGRRRRYVEEKVCYSILFHSNGYYFPRFFFFCCLYIRCITWNVFFFCSKETAKVRQQKV